MKRYYYPYTYLKNRGKKYEKNRKKVLFIRSISIIVPLLLLFMTSAKASADTEFQIKGSTTKEEYAAHFSALNEIQNEAWNQKFNFKPETKVVTAGTWDEFKASFEDESISKIILTGDIYYGRSIALKRSQSIEIDGAGHQITMIDGGLDIANFTKMSDFKPTFSDVPVFHMHDLSIITSETRNASNLGNARGFINGHGGEGKVARGLWQYRVGNIITPTFTDRDQNNQKVTRLIQGNNGQVSVWGYNEVITAAENFYLGGLEYEPYTYYCGELARENYSTIWFIHDFDSNVYTGDKKFVVGDGSFVYLYNQGTGTGFPAVYMHFDEIRIGENATYNANVPGTAVSFNRDNAKFIAEKNSNVNLLSRNNNYPTLALGSSASIGSSGAPSKPNNIGVEFKEGSNINIVGNTTRNSNGQSGVLGFYSSGRSANNASVVINSPNSLNISNLAGYGAIGFYNGGNFNFTLNDSDVSLWKTGTNLASSPDFTYPNVTNFNVNSTVTAAKGTSSNSGLQDNFVRNQIRQINGLNTTPEIEWDYTTTADYNQKAKVLLGYVAAGGSNPFDKNGAPIMNSMYADTVRMAQIEFTDTLGNTYTGYSGSDGYITWNKENHEIPGFQLANQNITGIPSKIDTSNGERTPYKKGALSESKVLLVTPPTPMKLVHERITVSDKTLSATNLEPNMSVLMQINDGQINEVGTVDASGKWDYILTNSFNIGDKVQIYLENTSELPEDFNKTGLENVRVDTKNRNPKVKTTYRDATFEPAPTYLVEKGVISEATVLKTMTSDTDTIGIGSTLTFTDKITNNEAEGSGMVWKDVLLSKVIDEGLDYDEKLANLKVNGKTVTNATYDKEKHELIIPIGDILPETSSGENIFTVNSDMIVNDKKLGQAIVNKATAIGKNDLGEDFIQESNTITTEPVADTRLTVTFVTVEGNPLNDPVVIISPIGSKVNLDENEEISEIVKQLTASDYILSKKPDPSIIEISDELETVDYVFDGILKITSAPKTMDFGKLKVSSKIQTIEDPTIDGELTITDTRFSSTQGWKLSAKIIKPMTNDLKGVVLPSALRYNNGGETPIVLSESDSLIEQRNTKGNTSISSEWGDTTGSKGVKLLYNPGAVGKGDTIGSYNGTIQWTLSEVP